MRGLLVTTLLVVSVTAAQAQQLASVQVDARVRIPEFLSVRDGRTQDVVRSDGAKVRRVTVLVSANHAWNLQVVREGAVVKTTQGSSGNDVEVVVELPYSEKNPSTDPPKLQYFFTAG